MKRFGIFNVMRGCCLKMTATWASGWELGSPVPPLFPRLGSVERGVVTGGEVSGWGWVAWVGCVCRIGGSIGVCRSGFFV